MGHDTKNLHKAKRVKNDEFYTRYEDVEKELIKYKEQLEGLWVYCPCDDYRWSNFYKYLKSNFNNFHLRHLTATNYDIGDGSYRCDFNGYEEVVTKMDGNGDFRSDECTRIMQNADIVITNPPFSLFMEFIQWLKENDFLIIGHTNAVTYKGFFSNIKDGTVKIPVFNKILKFDGGDVQIGWYTTLSVPYKNDLKLTKVYSPEYYPKYDNYDAIEVSKTVNIPMDYDGVMGVPITFLDKYNPNQFEIVDAREVALNDKQKNKKTYLIKDADGAINGKPTYARICVRHKK